MANRVIRALILYPLTFILFLGGIVLFPLLLLLRPIHRRWGASTEEANSPMPGDSELNASIFQATRAATINQFDNDGIPSATRIMPEFQNPQIGQVIGEEGLTVRVIEPNRSLVLSFSHPNTVWVFKEGIWPKFGASSLSYNLRPLENGRTRLVVRTRFAAKLFSLPILWWPFFEIGDFLNARKQLLAIKLRAENRAA
jgi:hypothetical protein